MKNIIKSAAGLIMLPLFVVATSCYQDTDPGSEIEPSSDEETDSEIGNSCDDCSGDCIFEIIWPGDIYKLAGGYCTHACEEDSDCGAGGGCSFGQTSLSGDEHSYCVKYCETDDDCARQGYYCGPGICVAGYEAIIPDYFDE